MADAFGYLGYVGVLLAHGALGHAGHFLGFFLVLSEVVAGACVAFVVGLLAVRTAGAFFIMVTLALAEMLFSWGYRSPTFGGANGMGGVPRLDLSAIGIDLNDPGVFALAMIVLCIVIWLMLARELLIAIATVALAFAGARRIDVVWAGKAGTLALMFALPMLRVSVCGVKS